VGSRKYKKKINNLLENVTIKYADPEFFEEYKSAF
jgi:hypothetical protein